MDFQIIDMIIIGLVLFLAIKGFVNGFSKELFNFLGIIGGIAVASRTNETVGALIAEQNILPQSVLEFQNIIGAVVVFVAMWIVLNIISSLISNLSSATPGIISRFIGYLIAIARYGFIFSLILFGFNNADFLKEKFSKYTEKSQLFKPMVQIGEQLLNKEGNQTLSIKASIPDSNLTIKDSIAVTENNSSI